jgi:hypothetical protein
MGETDTWDRACLGWVLQVGHEKDLVCSLQLCEDLFSRISENQSSQLSYSVEVSSSVGGGQGGGKVERLRLRAVSGVSLGWNSGSASD